MTREGPEERSDEGPSSKSSGESEAERREASEGERGDTTREQSDPRDREPPSGSTDDLFGGGEPDGGSAEAGGTSTAGDATATDTDSLHGETTADDADDEGVEPVEVLVALAEDGEIDPWDIDVVRVTDKFLEVVEESDLRTSGRALFYATVLIRLKSDAMLAGDDEQDEPDEPWEEAMVEGEPIDEPDPFSSLEREMDRRLERRRARGMPQTLDELVRDLRDAERDSWWKESRSYDTSDSPSGFQRGTQELDYRSADDLRMDDEPTEDDVTGTTHAENMDDVIDAVYDVLREHYDQGREEVLYREVQLAGGSRVETFLGVLFLSHRGRVRLQQDELFGDLWIQDPAAASGSEEALAD